MKAWLKTVLADLSKQAEQYNFDSTGMLFALARYAFPEASTSEIARIARMGRATAYRMEAKGFAFAPSQREAVEMSQVSQVSQNETVETVEKKEKEEEKKGFPPDPLYKEEKKKEKENPPKSACADVHTHEGKSDISEFLSELRAQYGETPAYTAAENVPADKVTQEPKGEIKYPEVMDQYWQTYPNRWDMCAINYTRFKHSWAETEARGWTGIALKTALNKFIADAKANPRMFKPDVFRFLNEEWMRNYLPAGEVAKMLGGKDFSEVSAVKCEPSFKEFLRIYPKRKGLSSPEEIAEIRDAWNNLISSVGYTDKEILRALKEAIPSKSWTDNNGQHIPTALNFLRDEHMLKFLPTGFKPRSRKTPADSTSQSKRTWKPVVYDGIDF